MKDILWLMRKTLFTTFRKKKNILLYLLTPLAGIFIALLAYGGQSSGMAIGVVNHDNGTAAEETIAFLEKLDNVHVKEMQESDVAGQVVSGDAAGVITFDEGYSDSVLAGEADHISITSIKGESVTGIVKSYLYPYIDNLTALGRAADGDKDVFQDMYQEFNQHHFQMQMTTLEDSSVNKMMTLSAIGFLIMIMMVSAANLAEIILAEKENRTYFRLLSTPITARKYIFSNVIVNMMVMIVQTGLTLLLLKDVFHIDLNIPFWQAFFVMVIFSLISVGVSLVIVAFSNSRNAVGALSNLVIIPTVMLSGCFWPVEVMPESIQRIADFLPQRWTLDTLQKLQDGSTLSSLYLNIGILFAFAAALFLVAIYKFNRNDSIKSFI